MKIAALSVLLFVGLASAQEVAPADPPTPAAEAEVVEKEAPVELRGFGRSRNTGTLTPEMVQRLSGEQLASVLKAQAHNEGGGEVAILVPLFFFLFVFLCVAGGLYAAFRRDRIRHETLRLAIEKGAAIPAELLSPPARKNADLRRGLLLSAAGIGIAIFLAALAPRPGVWTLGLIPLLIGIGYLITWRVGVMDARSAQAGQ